MEGEVIMSRSAFQPVPISNTGQFSHRESTGASVNHLDLNCLESLKMLSLDIAKYGSRTTEAWPIMKVSFSLSFKSILKLSFRRLCLLRTFILMTTKILLSTEIL